MVKSKHKTKSTNQKTLVWIGTLTVIGVIIGYFVYLSMIPVNAEFPVLGAPTNIYIKTISIEDGTSVYASQSIKGGKNGGGPNGIHNPTFTVSKGNLVSIHFINEDRVSSNGHQHDINIDEFNVHSRILSHFQAQTITFVADKQGTFDYYSSIHPNMKGKIIVT